MAGYMRVRTRTDEVLADHVLKLPYRDGIDVELPLEVLTHLSFASG